MKVPHLEFTRGTMVMAALAGAVALGLAGWALAEGELPLVSSSTPDTTTTTSAGTPGANTDNVAAAVNTKDGKSVFALSLKIVQTDSSTVDPVNAAVAVASCTDCQTVAIALEAVLVAGSPTTFEPTNIALAINSECSNCQTLAAAYQSVVQHDTRVRISGAGRRAIAAIRTDLQSLRNSELDIFVIWERVDQAAGRFLNVLQTEVYPIGRPAEAGETGGTTTTGPPSTAPTTTTATEPTTSTTLPSTTTALP
jgi:putative peptide zinc metalloprotease protein